MRTKFGPTTFLRLSGIGENSGAQAHNPKAGQSASECKRRIARPARSAKPRKPEFSQTAQFLAAKY
jgi:hypothetical protein